MVGPGARIGRNDPCWCGSGKKYKKCHEPADQAAGGAPRPAPRRPLEPGRVTPARDVPASIPRPEYAVSGLPRTSLRDVKNADELARQRRACRAAARVLRIAGRP